MPANQVSGLKIVVLGIGNVLLTDEEAGVHAVLFLEDSLRLDGVSFIDSGASNHR